MFALNFCVLFLLWLIRDFEVICISIVLIYEGITCSAIFFSIRKKDFIYRKFLGLWCWIIPLGTGIIFRIKYEFFETSDSIFRFGNDELVVLSISIVIGVAIMALINKMCRIKPGVFLNLLIVLIVIISIVGQTLLWNDALPYQKKECLKYTVVNKSISYRFPTTYVLSLENDDSHSCSVGISKDEYCRVEKGESFYLIVKRGGLGISYIENRTKAVKRQINL